jgi:hypothetical protein
MAMQKGEKKQKTGIGKKGLQISNYRFQEQRVPRTDNWNQVPNAEPVGWDYCPLFSIKDLRSTSLGPSVHFVRTYGAKGFINHPSGKISRKICVLRIFRLRIFLASLLNIHYIHSEFFRTIHFKSHP